MTRVQVDPRAATAYGVEGVLPVGAIVVVAGLVLILRANGALDEVGAGGHPRGGIAADPTAESHWPHGSAERFLDGCRCKDCREAANRHPW